MLATLPLLSPRRGALALALLLLWFLPAPARAVDTFETYSQGLTDLELYGFVEGLGAPADERWIGGELVLGVGLVEGLSVYLGIHTGADHHLAAGESGLYFALFGTPVDTDHLDLDLFLEVRTGGALLDAPAFVPRLELTLDAEPDMAAWGGFLRWGVPIFGVVDGQTGARQLGAELELVAGGYYTLPGDHQLFLAYGTPGALRLGANLVLGETLELILETAIAAPVGGEPMSLGVMTGLVAFWE
ncbi:MAG: hypothetical protein P1V51_13595 [Deltaproteobacteria bacterium]|nr:hypothetical protein [Deltaproteobacteria bacterium]